MKTCHLIGASLYFWIMPVMAGVVHSFGILPDTGSVPLFPPVDGKNGFLYGATSSGDASDGVIYGVSYGGGGLHVLHRFGLAHGDGRIPMGRLLLDSGVLYGVAQRGGLHGHGCVYRLSIADGACRLLHSFSGGSGGMSPQGGLLKLGGVLYGTTAQGGDAGHGVIYRIGEEGEGYDVMHHFGVSSQDGRRPTAELASVDGMLFGTTEVGGAYGKGTVFRIPANGGPCVTLTSFGASLSDAAFPSGGLVLAAGELWGVSLGGAFGTGTIYKVPPAGGPHTVVKTFNESGSAGYEPSGTLVLSGTTELFGTTQYGGNEDSGVVFRITTSGTGPTVRQHLTGPFGEGDYPDGEYPAGGLALVGSVLYGVCSSGGLFYEGTVFRVNTNGSGYKLMHPFSGEKGDGETPSGVLVNEGLIYGTTENGGIYGLGTLYRVRRSGADYRILHHFDGVSGESPNSELLLVDETIYGTTRYGGAQGAGTIFSIARDGSQFNTLRNMVTSTGIVPLAGLAHQAGLLYGSASQGGSGNLGVTFRLQLNGSGYTVLRHHAAADGTRVYCRPGITANEIFVAASSGGAHGKGTVFRRQLASSSLTLLRSFGAVPADLLAPGYLMLTGGRVWGLAASGGNLEGGGVFVMDLAGQNFSEIHVFPSGTSTEGNAPQAMLAGAGNLLLGSALSGGAGNSGTIWTMQTDGSDFQVVHAFQGAPGDGLSPSGDLALDGDVLYAATLYGGEKDSGTIVAVYLDEGSPQSETLEASSVTATSATLHGMANSAGRPATVKFDYGPTNAYGSSVQAVPAEIAGDANMPVSADLAGLSGRATYHYRVVLGGPGWSVAGEDMTFTTLNRPPVPQSDVFYILPGTNVTLDVLANDADPDGDLLEILAFSQPASGGHVAVENGRLLFQAGQDFVSASFDYTVGDGHGGEAGATVNLAVVSSFSQWIQALLAADLPDPGGPALDPDGDQLANLAEYALGRMPHVPDIETVVARVEAGVLRLYYERWKNAGDVTILPEFCTDLVQWSSANVTVEVLGDDGVRQQIKASAPAGAGHRFGRLRFEISE